ncbi:MAG: hypothetical protein KDD43_00020 [Bdellovibrionales bacterium]|nr:hypothetical protein [Bdellovibrionales bacterium]
MKLLECRNPACRQLISDGNGTLGDIRQHVGKKCPECGEGVLRIVDKPGRFEKDPEKVYDDKSKEQPKPKEKVHSKTHQKAPTE